MLTSNLPTGNVQTHPHPCINVYQRHKNKRKENGVHEIKLFYKIKVELSRSIATHNTKPHSLCKFQNCVCDVSSFYGAATVTGIEEQLTP